MSIAEHFSGTMRKTFLGGVEGKKQFADFCNARDYSVSVYSNGAYATPSSTDAAQKAWLGGAEVMRVSTRPFQAEIPLSARTKNGDEIEISVRTLAKAAGTESFWRAWGNYARACGAVLESAIAERVVRKSFLVVGEIEAYAFDDLTTNDALPANWWKTQLQGTFAELGLALEEVTGVAYASPSEEKKRELTLREAAEKERRERLEENARLEEEEARFVERRKRIEYDAKLNDAERELELKKIQFEADEFERQKTLAQKEFEKETIKRELEIENLRATPERDAEERARRDEEHKALLDSLQRSGEELKTMSEIAKQTMDELKRLREDDREDRETRSNPWNLEPSALRVLEELGVTPSKKFFSRFFRERERESVASRVGMELVEGKTRTATDVLPEVRSLEYGKATTMRFTAPIDGFVTILNLGTDGRFLLIAPNLPKANGEYAGKSPSAARVQRGREYSVPGGELYCHTLYEGGPDGLEEYVVLITPEPLFNDLASLDRAEPDSPFALVKPERLAQVVRDFNAAPKEKRAAGVLDFTVYGSSSRR